MSSYIKSAGMGITAFAIINYTMVVLGFGTGFAFGDSLPGQLFSQVSIYLGLFASYIYAPALAVGILVWVFGTMLPSRHVVAPLLPTPPRADDSSSGAAIDTSEVEPTNDQIERLTASADESSYVGLEPEDVSSETQDSQPTQWIGYPSLEDHSPPEQPKGLKPLDLSWVGFEGLKPNKPPRVFSYRLAIVRRCLPEPWHWPSRNRGV